MCNGLSSKAESWISFAGFGLLLTILGTELGGIVGASNVGLMTSTSQDRPLFLASAEYLIQLGLPSQMRTPLTKLEPREHTKASEQTLRLCNEQAGEIFIVGLLDTTPQERPRLLASTT